MKLHRVMAVVMRHTYEARHNLDRITDALYWPVMDIIVWGFFSIFLARSNRLQPGLISFLLGAAILWGMFRAFQRDMAVGFLSELWSRNLLNLFSSPLTVFEYMTGLIIVNLLKALLGMTAAALVAWLCYAYNFFPMIPAVLPFFLNLLLFAIAVGAIITGLIFRYSTRIQGLTWGLTGFLMPLSCVFYPLRSLPRYLQPAAWIMPTTQAFEGMRQVLAGGGFSLRFFFVGLTLDAIYMAAALVFFRMMFEAARNRGLLVKIE
jgi:ABC-2 type transport system permease protein